MGVGVRAEVNARDFARVVRVLRRVDKTLVDDLRDGFKSGILPIGKQIEARVNAVAAPMSGMNRNGRTRWSPLTAKVSTTPGYSRKYTSLVALQFTPKGGAGLAIAENAGSKSPGKTRNGVFFIRRLVAVVPGWDNGGRFLYRAFMPFKNDLYQLGENILDRWITKTNIELENI
jgi:hypothetical protein